MKNKIEDITFEIGDELAVIHDRENNVFCVFIVVDVEDGRPILDNSHEYWFFKGRPENVVPNHQFFRPEIPVNINYSVRMYRKRGGVWFTNLSIDD